MYGYKTLFGVEPLEMDEIQRQIYDAIYSKWKFGCPMRNSGDKAQKAFNGGDFLSAKNQLNPLAKYLIPINIFLGIVAVILGITLRGF